MATYSFSTLIDHTNDTGFRNWVTEFSGALAAIGLVQTSDTGQITTSTATRPGTNTAAGYQIYRFSDAAQANLPIFLKIEYGTANLANAPAVWVSAASTSTGAGSLTGTTFLSRVATGVSNAVVASTSTAYPSYFSYNTSTGFLGWGFKNGSASSGSHSSFGMGRSCDSTGAVTTSGVTTMYGHVNASTTNYQTAVNWLGTTLISGVSGKYSLSPGSRTSTAFGSDIQAFLNWTAYPMIEPINWRCSVVISELPAGTSFTTTLVGSTPHTYLSLGINFTYGDDATNNAAFGGAIIWE